ncbi:MAG: cytochrome C oxidase subunit IV family protein [Planctomycetota bacterium]|jgi:cytochrome c oxidase subunit 4
MTDERVESDEHGEHGVGHVVPVKILATTGFALLVLTVITVYVASFDFGNINIWVALSIAAVKASLVVLFFMHLRYDRPFNGIIFVTALAFVALFISFTLTDTREYAPEMDPGNAPAVEQRLAEIELAEIEVAETKE